MRKKALLLSTLIMLSAGAASAQSTGSITGVVTDGATGKPVVGALVVATSPAVPGQQTAVSDAKGSFTVPNLPAGQYRLQASFDGYKPELRADLALGENVTLRANLAMVPEAVQLEEVVVTGSRIKRKDLTTPAPVTVINKEQIQTSGKISVGDFLQAMPEQGNSMNGQVNNGNDGSVQVNLRSLGANRTLVLVNGRRMVYGGTGADAAVDLNTIPAAAIERIEVLKDGASAVYGSDAVAGVVNVILKRKYEGTEVSAYAGTSSRGDGRTYDLSAITGTSSERGSLIFSVGFQKQERILAGDRDFAKTTYSVDWNTGLKTTGGNSGTWPEGRFNLPAAACAIPSADPQVQAACAARAQQLAASGTSAIVPIFDPVSGKTTGYKPYDYVLYNTNPANNLFSPSQRVQLFTTGDTRLGTFGRGFFEASFVQRDSNGTTLAPMPLVNNNIPTNPIRVSSLSIYNPFGVDITTWRHRTNEFGTRVFNQKIDTFHTVIGIDGSLGDWAGPLRGWSWELAYNYGRTASQQDTSGQMSMSRVANAVGPSRWIDPNNHGLGAQCVKPGPTYPGNPADYKVIPGCVPMNVLGGAGAIDPAAAPYVTFVGTDIGLDQLEVVSFNVGGELFSLLADRPVALAVGYENRHEKASFRPDTTTAALDSSGNNQLATGGGFNANEAYAELVLPIVNRAPFAEDLELDLAARWFKYNLFGADKTYKVGGRYTVVPDATFRATYSTAFRAPQVGELFAGTQDDYPSVTDPCDGALSGKPLVTQQQCAAQGVGPTGSHDPSTQLLAKRLANPELKPETAKTFTVGVVLEPRWVPTLSVTVDYYKVTLEKAITLRSAGAVLAGCYLNGIASDCAHVNRDPVLGTINWVDRPRVNDDGKVEIAGVDLSSRYALPTEAFGRFGVGLDATYLQYYRTVTSAGQTTDQAGTYDGLLALPKWKFNLGLTYGIERLVAGLNLRYIGTYKECNNGSCADDATDARMIPTYVPVDLHVGYSIKSVAGVTAFMVGVNNLMDLQPPFIATANNFNSDPSTYDYAGRYFYARLTQTF